MAIPLTKKFTLWFTPMKVQVIVYYNYKNAIIPRIYKGTYIKRVQQTDGGELENYSFFIKRSFLNFEELPHISMNFIDIVGDTRTLQVLKIDEDTFLPLIPIRDLEIDAVVQKKDENGNLVKNEKGEVETMVERRKFLFATQMVTKNGLKEIPVLMPQENYANKLWAQHQHIRASLKYASKSWWDKYGHFVLIFVMLLGTAVGIKFIWDGFNQSLTTMAASASAIATANADLAKAIVEGLKQLKP